MSAESATPPARELKRLIDRLVARTAGRPIREVGALVGVSGTYISKWRTGFRPKRMSAHALARLRRAVQELETPGATVQEAQMGADAAEDPVGFARGVLWIIQRQAADIARTAAAAVVQLGGGPDAREERATPSAAAIADGLAALRREEERKTTRGPASKKPARG